MVSIRCNDCDFESLGKIEGVIFDYWQHMNNTHGMDHAERTIGKRVAEKTPNAD